jgi:predicted TIM-barrel fold metal-dependent hydrolase
MIVDCHTHLWKYPGHLSDQFVKEANLMRAAPVDMNIDLDKHYEAMKQVDKAVVLGFKAKHVGVNVPNDYVAEYVKRDPQRLIGFLGVEPQDKNAVAEIERSVNELGLRGIKLAPIYQNFDPTDKTAYKIYKTALKLRLPILFHMGTTFCRFAPLEYGNPVLLEKVARDFPDLKMVIAHLAHPWQPDTIVLIRKQPNVYGDISGLFYRPWQFYNAMIAALEWGVSHKLLFGTDYPVATAREMIEGMRKVNRVVEGTGLPKVPEQVIDDIIHRNTLELLGLK